MISSHVHVKISCLITILFCPFNYTSICWCMIEKSSDLLPSCSAIFGYLRKMFGNVRLAFVTILENLRNSSESGRKSSENSRKRRHQHVYIIKAQYTLARSRSPLLLEDMNFMFSWQDGYISLVRCSHS